MHPPWNTGQSSLFYTYKSRLQLPSWVFSVGSIRNQHGPYRRSHLYQFLLSSPALMDNSILSGSYKTCPISMGHVDHRIISLGSPGKSQVEGQYCWSCQEGRADSEGGRATALWAMPSTHIYLLQSSDDLHWRHQFLPQAGVSKQCHILPPALHLYKSCFIA